MQMNGNLPQCCMLGHIDVQHFLCQLPDKGHQCLDLGSIPSDPVRLIFGFEEGGDKTIKSVWCITITMKKMHSCIDATASLLLTGAPKKAQDLMEKVAYEVCCHSYSRDVQPIHAENLMVKPRCCKPWVQTASGFQNSSRRILHGSGAHFSKSHWTALA